MSLSDPTGGANSGAPTGARLPQTITLNAGQPGQIRAAVATGGQVVTMSQQAATASGNGGATNRCGLRNCIFFLQLSHPLHCNAGSLFNIFAKTQLRKKLNFCPIRTGPKLKVEATFLFNEQIGEILTCLSNNSK